MNLDNISQHVSRLEVVELKINHLNDENEERMKIKVLISHLSPLMQKNFDPSPHEMHF
jgi:hypothetical protein